ncbi:hypothetical protein CVT26_013780 [Gymnopilus dilepis]|uniref:Uncharacterized protein n=1 Tax=Gymnopilus dilepis TaxID=231916 RepID=A0A409Y6B5_9AGAR|nr:hypothetical protein CVT26_013780 [Gymnopilus dilepis]
MDDDARTDESDVRFGGRDALDVRYEGVDPLEVVIRVRSWCSCDSIHASHNSTEGRSTMRRQLFIARRRGQSTGTGEDDGMVAVLLIQIWEVPLAHVVCVEAEGAALGRRGALQVGRVDVGVGPVLGQGGAGEVAAEEEGELGHWVIGGEGGGKGEGIQARMDGFPESECLPDMDGGVRSLYAMLGQSKAGSLCFLFSFPPLYMHDSDTSGLAAEEHSPSSSSRLIVAATIAAVLLAGSAFVYRTRPGAARGLALPFLSAAAADADASASEGDDAHSDKKRKTAGDEGVGGGASGSFVVMLTASGGLLGNVGSKEKEGKTPRSKDRRRRGKDPLKELLKGGGKKYKALALAVSSTHHPGHHDEHEHEHEHLEDEDGEAFPPSTASTSALPDTPLSPSTTRAAATSNTSPSVTAKGKRAQREKSATPDTPAHPSSSSHFDSPSTTAAAADGPSHFSSATHTHPHAPSSHHSRGPSEVSQKHTRMGDGPPRQGGPGSFSLEIQNHGLNHASGSRDHSHPSQSQSPSTSNSTSTHADTDTHTNSLGFARPHSALSMAEEGSHSPTSSSNVPLADHDQTQTRSESAEHPEGGLRQRQGRGKAKGTYTNTNTYANMNGAISTTSAASSTAASRSPSAASTADTTAGASMTSSIVLENTGDVLTPATSPTLSVFASGSGSGAVQDSHMSREGNKLSGPGPDTSSVGNSGSGKGKKRDSGAGGSDDREKDKEVTKGNEKEKHKGNDKEKDKDGYKKPPRLHQNQTQQGSSSTSSSGTVKSPPSATSSSSLYSPTKGSFAAAAASGSGAGSMLSPSITGRSSPLARGYAEGAQRDGERSKEREREREREREEEEAFTFPSLNPTPLSGMSFFLSSILVSFPSASFSLILSLLYIISDANETPRSEPPPPRHHQRAHPELEPREQQQPAKGAYAPPAWDAFSQLQFAFQLPFQLKHLNTSNDVAHLGFLPSRLFLLSPFNLLCPRLKFNVQPVVQPKFLKPILHVNNIKHPRPVDADTARLVKRGTRGRKTERREVQDRDGEGGEGAGCGAVGECGLEEG